jgi:hypothetical protein
LGQKEADLRRPEWEIATADLLRSVESRHDFDLGWRGYQIARQATYTAGSAFAAWVHRLLDRGPKGPESKLQWEVRPELAPAELEEAMEECQKPFQLWNVERACRDEEFELLPVPKFSVGASARLDPVLVFAPAATRALSSFIEETKIRKLTQDLERRHFRSLLRDPLPYGRADDEDPQGDDTWDAPRGRGE